MNNTQFLSSQNIIKSKSHNSKSMIKIVLSILIALIVYLSIYMFSGVTLDKDTTITIPSGYSLQEVTVLLEEKKLVRSRYAPLVLSQLQPFTVKSGTYLFLEGKLTLREISRRLSSADYGDIYLRLTIPEGSTRNEIAENISRTDLAIDPDEFLSKTSDLEGYLFPDTYFFLPDDNVDTVIQKMTSRFDDVVSEFSSGIEGSGRSLEDIIIMASIVEKEATGDLEEMKTVAGILWKRIDQGMLLQVDAPFLYTQGKESSELTLEELRTDGLYNTYTRKGLTPAPISNPGRNALEAAIYPQESLYFFYLHDTSGMIHYGVNHDEHVRNKQRYLR